MKIPKLPGALALSMLVCPGTGHFLYKRWIRGALWVAVFSTVFTSFMAIFGSYGSKLMTSMMSPNGDIDIDINQIGLGARLMLGSFVLWAMAAADTYWVARQAAVLAQHNPAKVVDSVSESLAAGQPESC